MRYYWYINSFAVWFHIYDCTQLCISMYFRCRYPSKHAGFHDNRYVPNMPSGILQVWCFHFILLCLCWAKCDRKHCRHQTKPKTMSFPHCFSSSFGHLRLKLESSRTCALQEQGLGAVRWHHLPLCFVTPFQHLSPLTGREWCDGRRLG